MLSSSVVNISKETLKAGSDFEKVVGLYLSKSANLSLEEIDNQETLQRMVAAINEKRFSDLEFPPEQFSRYLLQALRLNLINHDDFLTTKLLYDSLQFFHSGETPTDLSKWMKKIQLTSKNVDEIFHYPYKTKTIAEKLKQNLNKDDYYFKLTVPFNLCAHLILAIHSVQNFSNKNLSLGYSIFLKAYLDSNSIKNLQQSNSAFLSRQTHLKSIMQKQLPNFKFDDILWNNFLFCSSILKAEPFFQCFLFNINHFDDSSEPFFHFVLPSIHTLKKVLNAYFENNAVHPQAVIGVVAPSDIRFMHEKNLDDLKFVDSDILQKYKIYDQNQYRPVEISYPDLPRNNAPHGYKLCSDFLLSFHDVLHAIRSSSLQSPLVHQLRKIQDEKVGLAKFHDGISKIQYSLSDLDMDYGHVFYFDEYQRQNFASFSTTFLQLEYRNHFQNSSLSIKGVTYDSYSTKCNLLISYLLHYIDDEIDNEYSKEKHSAPQVTLLALNMWQNKKLWQTILDVSNLDDFVRKIGPYEDLEIDFEEIYFSFDNIKQELSDASLLVLSTLDLLHNNTLRNLFLEFDKIYSVDNIIYWSRNTGLFFQDSWRDFISEKLFKSQEPNYNLKEFNKNQLLAIFSYIYAQQNPDNMELVKNIIVEKIQLYHEFFPEKLVKPKFLIQKIMHNKNLKDNDLRDLLSHPQTQKNYLVKLEKILIPNKFSSKAPPNLATPFFHMKNVGLIFNEQNNLKKFPNSILNKSFK